MIAAAMPLTTVAANPNFFILVSFFLFMSRHLNGLVSGLIPLTQAPVMDVSHIERFSETSFTL